ncbi:MAG TPA: adenylate cyclase regulatory domain-containing protein, partial [Actinomycetes bacterium]|nr:adenylate cyclase regulatory domain-containing protein [Actinomycetes bacterium]
MSADELARLAEAEPAFVERAIQAGALQQRETAGGFGIQDAARLRFLKAWDTAGLPVETIGHLIARGELPFSFMDAPTMGAQPRLPSTYEEFCTQRGIDLSLVQRLHDALGFTPPAASDHVREDDLIVVDLLQQWLVVGAEEAAALRLLRTYADALRRLTQAEADLYEAQIEEPQRQGGATEQDLLNQSGAVGAHLVPLLQQTLVALYRRHRQHVWLDHSIGHLERILEAKGLYQRLDTPPCVCFVDLTGFTRLTEEQGDAAAAELAGRLAALVEGISRRYGGRPVRWLGDGGMLVFREPTAAVAAAMDMVVQAEHGGLPPTHIGIHCGPMVFQDGDIYGSSVNIAARLSARAGPGEVLVSRPAAGRLPQPSGLEPV